MLARPYAESRSLPAERQHCAFEETRPIGGKSGSARGAKAGLLYADRSVIHGLPSLQQHRGLFARTKRAGWLHPDRRPFPSPGGQR
jgi:hypothetical protein